MFHELLHYNIILFIFACSIDSLTHATDQVSSANSSENSSSSKNKNPNTTSTKPKRIRGVGEYISLPPPDEAKLAVLKEKELHLFSLGTQKWGYDDRPDEAFVFLCLSLWNKLNVIGISLAPADNPYADCRSSKKPMHDRKKRGGAVYKVYYTTIPVEKSFQGDLVRCDCKYVSSFNQMTIQRTNRYFFVHKLKQDNHYLILTPQSRISYLMLNVVDFQVLS